MLAHTLRKLSSSSLGALRPLLLLVGAAWKGVPAAGGATA